MTDREAAAGLVELRRKLAGVSCHAFGGDNLAIFLASEFEPGVEDDEMDESETWKQGAIDLSNQVMDAIHAHYAAAFTTLLSEIERMGKERDEVRALVAEAKADAKASFNHGVIFAAYHAARAHGEDTIAEELLSHIGIETVKELKVAGGQTCDVQALRHLLKRTRS